MADGGGGQVRLLADPAASWNLAPGDVPEAERVRRERARDARRSRPPIDHRKPREQTAITVIDHRQTLLLLLIFLIAIQVRDAGIAGKQKRQRRFTIRL